MYRPNLKPSRELAYILGVLLGDGTVTYNGKNGYVVKLKTKDYTFANEFVLMLKKIGLNPVIYTEKVSKYNKNWNDCYVVRAFSKIFYKWYKSLTIDDIIRIVKGYEKDFIRGFYESEGSIWKRNDNNQLRIRIVNTNHKLMNAICSMLRELGFNCKLRSRLGSKRQAYEITIEGNNVVSRFFRIINPKIKNVVEG